MGAPHSDIGMFPIRGDPVGKRLLGGMKLNAAGEYLDQFDHRDQRRLREQDRPPACEDSDAADWDRRSIAIRAPPDPSPATRSIHICCASWRLRDRTKSGDGNHLHSDGDWLRRSRYGVGLRSTSRSVVATVDHKLLRRTLAYSLARPGKPDIFNTAQALSSLDRPLPACSPTTVLRSAWTERRIVRQRVCRTALEQRQTRGDVPAMTASAGRAARSAYISTSITVGVPIPVMTAARRLKPTLPAAIPYGSLTPRQRSHLSTQKQPGPALFHWRDIPTGTLCPCCNSPICIGQQPARS